MRRSWRPRGCRPLVAAAVPYPTLTFAGQPASSFRILLVTPRARLHAGFTRLYRQLSCRMNAGLLLFAILFHFRWSGGRLETGLCVDVNAIEEDAEIFLLDLCRILDVGCGLAYGFDVDSLNRDIVAFYSDLHSVKYLGGPGCFLAGEVLDLECLCLLVDLYSDREVSIHGSEIIPVALCYPSDHVSYVRCRCSQHSDLSLARPGDRYLDFSTTLGTLDRQVR